MAQTKLTLLFDGGCPLCIREITFLRSRDEFKRISFVDIDSLNYNSDLYQGISYRDAMGTIHALTDSGEVLKGVRVFREAYTLVGLNWVYAPTQLPILEFIVDSLYRLWTFSRFRLTGRPSLNQLCQNRKDCFENE